jgi:protease I
MLIACIVEDEFEDSELRVPYDALTGAGHTVVLISRKVGQELHGKKKQERVLADRAIDDVIVRDYEALLIPGGKSPAKLRDDRRFLSFVQEFAKTGKPIAAICHGPQLLISADLVRGRTMTAWPEVQKELAAAGAKVVDQEVVVDGQFITSRKPDDLPAFVRETLRALGEQPTATP